MNSKLFCFTNELQIVRQIKQENDFNNNNIIKNENPNQQNSSTNQQQPTKRQRLLIQSTTNNSMKNPLSTIPNDDNPDTNNNNENTTEQSSTNDNINDNDIATTTNNNICVECKNKNADLLFGSFLLADPCHCTYCSECVKRIPRLPHRCATSYDHKEIIRFVTLADIELQKTEQRRKIYNEEWNLSEKDETFTNMDSCNYKQFDTYLELREELVCTIMCNNNNTNPIILKHIENLRERFRQTFKEFIGKNIARVNEIRRQLYQQVLAEESEKLKKLDMFAMQDRLERIEFEKRKREQNRVLLLGKSVQQQQQQQLGIKKSNQPQHYQGRARYIRTMGVLLQPIPSTATTTSTTNKQKSSNNKILERRGGGMSDKRIEERSEHEMRLGWVKYLVSSGS
jgi:hypothetical protein